MVGGGGGNGDLGGVANGELRCAGDPNDGGCGGATGMDELLLPIGGGGGGAGGGDVDPLFPPIIGGGGGGGGGGGVEGVLLLLLPYDGLGMTGG